MEQTDCGEAEAKKLLKLAGGDEVDAILMSTRLNDELLENDNYDEIKTSKKSETSNPDIPAELQQKLHIMGEMCQKLLVRFESIHRELESNDFNLKYWNFVNCN